MGPLNSIPGDIVSSAAFGAGRRPSAKAGRHALPPGCDLSGSRLPKQKGMHYARMQGGAPYPLKKTLVVSHWAVGPNSKASDMFGVITSSSKHRCRCCLMHTCSHSQTAMVSNGHYCVHWRPAHEACSLPHWHGAQCSSAGTNTPLSRCQPMADRMDIVPPACLLLVEEHATTHHHQHRWCLWGSYVVGAQWDEGNMVHAMKRFGGTTVGWRFGDG